MISFLFPADPLDARRVDEHFAPQRAALEAAGFATSLVPDAVLDRGGEVGGFPPNATVVYRGWMVDAAQYRNLHDAIQRGGGVPLTSPPAYLLAHHLPNWYPLLRDLTPETVVFSEEANLESELRALAWPAFFLKDYVKSLKTTAGSLITDAAEAGRVVEDMRRYRGTIEGGICVRRVERFGEEARSFVLSGRAFAPEGQTVPEIVRIVAERIDHPFFSVDVAINDNGAHRIVEIGDGQVSDLVGWPVEDFVRIWSFL